MINDVMGNLAAIFDRRVGLLDNLDAVEIAFTSNGLPDTEDAIVHLLGRKPIRFIVTYKDKAADVYNSGTAWTSTQIYLKTNVASAAIKLLVF